MTAHQIVGTDVQRIVGKNMPLATAGDTCGRANDDIYLTTCTLRRDHDGPHVTHNIEGYALIIWSDES